ncbi:hypothetical protein ILUMI_25083 [Ignelater luminosus]|uniref:Pyrroline-5-carboxylate reductase n=1 Tax=Ignelater luminosus TaxID=2038154 RepID=A0A8K0C986_IGNLU|nr:hypothetical protein ILUMI_25083 [Ignelater luminosus]
MIYYHSFVNRLFLKNFKRRSALQISTNVFLCNNKTIKTQNKIQQRIGFIGDGNMSKAIFRSMIKYNLIDTSQVYVASPFKQNLDIWVKWNANVTLDNSEVTEKCDIIFLAVKPYLLSNAVATMYSEKKLKKISNKLFVSILAGITLETLENVLSKFPGSRVIRVLPNTPMLVGEGCSIFCPGKYATREDIDLLQIILNTSGISEQVPENMINPIGALSGSGPAFVYLIIEALSDGCVRMGVHRDIATKFAAKTVLGAAKMVLETNKHPGVLKDEVCSAGGTTIAGIHALEKAGVRGGMMNAIEASAIRAVEVGKQK